MCFVKQNETAYLDDTSSNKHSAKNIYYSTSKVKSKGVFKLKLLDRPNTQTCSPPKIIKSDNFFSNLSRVGPNFCLHASNYDLL